MVFFFQMYILKHTHVSNDKLKFGVKSTYAACNRCLSDLQGGGQLRVENLPTPKQ